MDFYQQITANKRKSWFLMIFFIIFIVGISWIFTLSLGYSQQEQYGILTVFGIGAILFTLISYFSGAKLALSLNGAKQAPREDDYLELHRIVENLAITAGVPKPQVYVINDSSPNAFATGRDPKNSAIAVSTGLLEILERNELEGVIANELSHIRNYDIRFMMLVAVLVGFVAILADFFQRTVFYGGARRSKSNSKGGRAIIIIALVISILSPIIAKFIQLAISRKREYLADASGAQLTRYPEGLAKALEKISANDTSMKKAGTATAHLFIASPFAKKKNKSWFKDWFSTHPNTENRIALLRGLETA
jgi:heat shock protein HtpX